MLLNNILLNEKVLVPKEEVLDKLKDRDLEVLLTIGAGDIDRLIEPIKKYLKND
jgi:UDP-N-acetylmuramate--alanine ligase